MDQCTLQHTMQCSVTMKLDHLLDALLQDFYPMPQMIPRILSSSHGFSSPSGAPQCWCPKLTFPSMTLHQLELFKLGALLVYKMQIQQLKAWVLKTWSSPNYVILIGSSYLLRCVCTLWTNIPDISLETFQVVLDSFLSLADCGIIYEMMPKVLN